MHTVNHHATLCFVSLRFSLGYAMPVLLSMTLPPACHLCIAMLHHLKSIDQSFFCGLCFFSPCLVRIYRGWVWLHIKCVPLCPDHFQPDAPSQTYAEVRLCQ